MAIGDVGEKKKGTTKKMTTEEMERRGRQIAAILGLRRDYNYKDRFFTLSGSRTSLSIYYAAKTLIGEGSRLRLDKGGSQ